MAKTIGTNVLFGNDNVSDIGTSTGSRPRDLWVGRKVTGSINDTGGQVYNVKTFGAAGDGSTDDTTAIQSAVSACVTNGGGTVLFPPGTYFINSYSTVGGSNDCIRINNTGSTPITVALEGRDATVTTPLGLNVNPSLVNVFHFFGAHVNSSVRSMKFVGTHGLIQGTIAAVAVSGGNNNTGFLMTGCESHNFGQHVWMSGCTSPRIIGNTFIQDKGRDSGNFGLPAGLGTAPNVAIFVYTSADFQCSNVVVSENYYDGCALGLSGTTYSWPGDGLLAGTAQGWLVTNNVIKNHAFEGIQINARNGSSPQFTTLASSYTAGSGSITVVSASHFGSPSSTNPIKIQLRNTSTNAHAIYLCTSISGNTLTIGSAIEGTTDQSFAIGDEVEMVVDFPCLIADNAIDSGFPLGTAFPSSAPLQNYSICIQESAADVIDNVITNASYGVIVNEGARGLPRNVNVSGNHISMVSAPNYSYAGVSSSVSTHVKICDNKIVFSSYATTASYVIGIAASNCDNLFVSGNFVESSSVSGPTIIGILLNGGTSLQLVRNTTNNLNYGIVPQNGALPYIYGHLSTNVTSELNGPSAAYMATASSGNLGLGIFPSYGLHLLGGSARIQALVTPSTPVVTPVGTAGTTSYTYYVVATDRAGNKTLVSPVGTTATGNATLSGTNYNAITWSAVTGAATYDVLKGDTAHSIATGISATSFNDIGGSTSAYTAPTRNFSSDLTVDGFLKTSAVVSAGSVPTVAAGLGAGSSPTISCSGNGVQGYVTLTTGSAPSASATVFTLTFPTVYGAAPNVFLLPANPAADAISGNGLVAADRSNITASSFAATVGSTALAASTQYQWRYLVVG